MSVAPARRRAAAAAGRTDIILPATNRISEHRYRPARADAMRFSRRCLLPTWLRCRAVH